MYVCGITPYDATHIGHANTYVAFDLLQPGLARSRPRGELRSERDRHRRPAAGAGRGDRCRLGRHSPSSRRSCSARTWRRSTCCRRAHYVGAVESIPLIVDLIDQLQRREAVYPVDDSEFDDLYFAQASDSEFGSLSHLSEEQAIALFAERGGDPDRPGKKAPLDCLVWRHGPRRRAELGVAA